MKEELKTLKDIEQHGYKHSCVEIKKLKKEAIKWVKYYREQSLNKMLGKRLRTAYQGAEKGLMHFHNITEEDLK